MLSFLNKYPLSLHFNISWGWGPPRAAQRCNKGSSEVLWVRWCENIELNRFHDKNHLPGLKGAAHLTDCSSKPKLLTGQRKLCLFWPTFSHGVPGLSDFLLQKQYGLFRANKARLVGELSLQITDIVSSYAEAEHKPGTDWGSGCEGGHWSPDAELMQCCSQSTSPSHCSDCGNTVPASPGHGSLELAPPKHQTEVITGAWSLLSIDIGNAVKIISTSTTGSPFPVTVKLQRPVHCHPHRLCVVSVV